VNEEQFDCEFVRDLLPAYAGQSASAKTNAIVEEHIQDCPPCREEREVRRKGDARALQIGQGILEKYSRRHSKKFKRTVLLSVTLSLAGVIGIAALLFGVRVPVTLTLEDMVLSANYGVHNYEGREDGREEVGSVNFGMKYHRKPGTPYIHEWSATHYDDATDTLTEYTFYNIAPRLVDVLCSPIAPHLFQRSSGYSYEYPEIQDEEGQMQPKYPNVVWKVYYYQYRDESILYNVTFPDDIEGIYRRQSLLDSKGNLKPEIVEIATLIWEGPIEEIPMR